MDALKAERIREELTKGFTAAVAQAMDASGLRGVFCAVVVRDEFGIAIDAATCVSGDRAQIDKELDACIDKVATLVDEHVLKLPGVYVHRDLGKEAS